MNKLKNTQKQMSNNVGALFTAPEGITLIALIITIIVLLILAGVTLVMVMGDNGIISKAQTAKEKINITQEQEEQQLGNLEDKLNDYSIPRTTTSQNYTTGEQIVGTWIDGKTLYQQTIQLNTTKEGTQNYPHNIKDVDTIFIDQGGTFTQSTSSSFQGNPFYIGYNGNGKLNDEGHLTYIQTVNKTNILIRAGEKTPIDKAVVTLKYTKIE